MARHLDLDTWPRRDAFEFYRRFDKPYFNVCTRLDLTGLVSLKSRLPGGITLAYHHLVLRWANRIDPFRWRLDGGRVRVLDTVDGSLAVLRTDGSIAFARVPYHAGLADFAADAQPRVRAVVEGRTPFDPEADEQALLHFTVVPWFDFTSFSHARNWGREDAVPKFAFGRLVNEGGRWRMAFSVEVHHALMDGLHVGQLVQGIEADLADPQAWLGIGR